MCEGARGGTVGKSTPHETQTKRGLYIVGTAKHASSVLEVDR
jgi:hypothetical protein